MLFPVKHPKDSVFRLTWEFVMDASENCDEGSREKAKAEGLARGKAVLTGSGTTSLSWASCGRLRERHKLGFAVAQGWPGSLSTVTLSFSLAFFQVPQVHSICARTTFL